MLRSHLWVIANTQQDSHEILAVILNTINQELESLEKDLGYDILHRMSPSSIIGNSDCYSANIGVSRVTLHEFVNKVKTFDNTSQADAATENEEPKMSSGRRSVGDVFQSNDKPRLESQSAPFVGFFAIQLQCSACLKKVTQLDLTLS